MRGFKIEKKFTDRTEKCVEKYFNELKKIESISPEREVELTLKIKSGDERALNELVRANLRFVVSVAKKYENSGIELIDLINDGNLGLIKAAKRFDETKGFKFITFAVWWIRQSIIKSIADKKRIVRVPANKNLGSGKYLQAISFLNQELEREPTNEELAEFMDVDSSELPSFINATKSHSSLDAQINSEEGSATMGDFLIDENSIGTDNSLIDDSLRKDMFRALNVLSEKERNVLIQIYGIGCKSVSKEQVAIKMGYTSERIRQITKEAERKLFKSGSARNLLKKYI